MAQISAITRRKKKFANFNRRAKNVLSSFSANFCSLLRKIQPLGTEQKTSMISIQH